MMLRLGLALGLLALTACSHGEKKTTPDLQSMLGRKVALVEIDGQPKPRAMVEVALINQLTKHGTFILIPKEEVETSRLKAELSPLAWKLIAREAGADYALRVKVLTWEVRTDEGYSKETVEDSELAAERGESARMAERLYKVKAQTGHVKYQLEFTGVSDGVAQETRLAYAEKEETETAEGKTGGIHLSPSLRFMERLTNAAFDQFFETYR